jgi:hypothetical protein
MEKKTESECINHFKEYSPSWVDHLTGWVNRLPGPSWSYYIGLALLLFIFQVIALLIEGLFPINRIDTAHFFLAAATPYMLALIHYFDRQASFALAKLRPSMDTGDKENEQLDYQLTTLPARQTLLAGLLGFSCIFVLEAISGEPYQLEALINFPISGVLLRILYMILWWVFGTLVYHTVHQLRLIGCIYTQHTHINLFRMKDLFAFSNLIALTAGCMALLPIGFLIANPWASWTDPVVFGTVIAVQIIALATFIWPHFGIHRLQVAEKERLLEEANKRFEAIILKLHQRVDDEVLEGAMDMSMTVSSLNTEISTIEKIPTWPWQPETLRILITALAFPLGVWFIQLLLGRFFGN